MSKMSSNKTQLKDFRDRVILGDCITVMKSMPENCIDAIVTDPP